MTYLRLAFVACVLLGYLIIGHADDRTTYPDTDRPKVLINWDSFERQGMPASWKLPFQNVVINSYTRLNRVLGVRVRPQFAGYTTETDSKAGEIVISMNEKHADSSRLASTFGSFPNRLKIVFHRKRGSDLTPWNWTPFWPNSGEYSMQGVLMHEYLHAFGLDHSAPTKTIMGSYSWTSHHGPWSGDQSDIRAVHSIQDKNRLRQLATYNAGNSWSNLSNDITNFGREWGRTTNRVAAAGNHRSSEYIVGWSAPDNRLTWVRGDGVSFPVANWQGYTSHPRPRYGSAMKSDNRNTFIWAVVDGRSDDNLVKVLRSTNNGDSWSYTGFPVAKTTSTPGITRTVVDGRDAWVVVWVNYDESDRDETGFIYASTSFDSGNSWTQPNRVDDFYRVHDGVSIASTPDGVNRVTFVWAGEKDEWEYGQNKVRSFLVDVSNSGVVTRGTLCFGGVHSRIAPDLAWHSTTSRTTIGIREQDFNTSLMSTNLEPEACFSSASHINSSTTHVAPGLAENRGWQVPGIGTEIVMWGARD